MSMKRNKETRKNLTIYLPKGEEEKLRRWAKEEARYQGAESYSSMFVFWLRRARALRKELERSQHLSELKINKELVSVNE